MLQELTGRILAGRDLGREEAEAALESILSEDTPEVAVASFLTALAMKGETAEEVAAFARVMRRHARTIRSSRTELIDTAGTGGGVDTFNISTAAAFVISGAGVAVAKHGNRAVTSRCGSADVLTALGVTVDRPPEVAEQALEEIGLAFLFAPIFHPAMKRVAQIRRQLGHRTIFNLLGPLTNPASAPFQIIGVFEPSLTEKLGRALALLGCRRAWVVHGEDGMDELSISAPTRIADVNGGGVRNFNFEPWSYSERAPQESRQLLAGGGPQENAAKILGVLEGTLSGPAREVVVLNAAAALHVAGESDFERALSRARESLENGAARHKLEQLIRHYA